MLSLLVNLNLVAVLFRDHLGEEPFACINAELAALDVLTVLVSLERELRDTPPPPESPDSEVTSCT